MAPVNTKLRVEKGKWKRRNGWIEEGKEIDGHNRKGHATDS